MFYARYLKLKIFFGILVFILPLATLAQSPVSWSLESDAKGKIVKEGESLKANLKANRREV